MTIPISVWSIVVTLVLGVLSSGAAFYAAWSKSRDRNEDQSTEHYKTLLKEKNSRIAGLKSEVQRYYGLREADRRRAEEWREKYYDCRESLLE